MCTITGLLNDLLNGGIKELVVNKWYKTGGY